MAVLNRRTHCPRPDPPSSARKFVDERRNDRAAAAAGRYAVRVSTLQQKSAAARQQGLQLAPGILLTAEPSKLGWYTGIFKRLCI